MLQPNNLFKTWNLNTIHTLLVVGFSHVQQLTTQGNHTIQIMTPSLRISVYSCNRFFTARLASAWFGVPLIRDVFDQSVIFNCADWFPLKNKTILSTSTVLLIISFINDLIGLHLDPNEDIFRVTFSQFYFYYILLYCKVCLWWGDTDIFGTKSIFLPPADKQMEFLNQFGKPTWIDILRLPHSRCFNVPQSWKLKIKEIAWELITGKEKEIYRFYSLMFTYVSQMAWHCFYLMIK